MLIMLSIFIGIPIVFFGLRMVPDVRYESQPHQGALCCIVSVGLLLFLNRKTEKPKNRKSRGFLPALAAATRRR
jgi:hypothetical protein